MAIRGRARRRGRRMVDVGGSHLPGHGPTHPLQCSRGSTCSNVSFGGRVVKRNPFLGLRFAQYDLAMAKPLTATPTTGYRWPKASRSPPWAHSTTRENLVRPGLTVSKGSKRAINGRLEHLRGTALGFRNLTNYIARALLESGGFSPRLHP